MKTNQTSSWNIVLFHRRSWEFLLFVINKQKWKKTIYKKEKTVQKLELISVFRRIILGRHHQTPSFSGSSIHRFYNVNHLLFVLHGPVDLVVVSGSQINHDVFVSGKQKRGGNVGAQLWGAVFLWRGFLTWRRTWRCMDRTTRTSYWSRALLWCLPGKWRQSSSPEETEESFTATKHCTLIEEDQQTKAVPCVQFCHKPLF